MKTVIFLIISTIFLNGCFQVVTLVGPALSGYTTGNIAQSAISYTVSYGVKKATGKSIIENVIEISRDKESIAKNKKIGEFENSFRPVSRNKF